MKLKSIKISNILSFEQKNNIDECEEIPFDKKLNILIGANGSGKSNFLEILNKIFKSALIRGCTFNETILEKNPEDPNRYPLYQVMAHRDVFHNLPKNYESDNDLKEIKIKLLLEQSDYDNLSFIIKNLVEIQNFLGAYSSGLQKFEETISEDDIKKKDIIEFHFADKNSSNKFIIENDFSNDKSLSFIFTYFQNYNFVQNVILLANRIHGKSWQPLKQIMTLLSSYRNYDRITDKYTIQPNEFDQLQQIFNKIVDESARRAEEKEPIVFDFVKHRFSHRMNSIEYQLINAKLSNSENKTSLDFLKEEDTVFKGIEKLLKSSLDLSLYIENKEKSLDYNFSFRYSTGKKIDVFDLSSGEKGIIHFIFSLYGYDMKNGVMIIDEPELHLHPQVQKKYLEIIREVKDDLDTQFILATHSSIFVNPETIDGVKRFYMDNNNSTKVISPSLSDKERDLVRILSYTNSSKIFFAKRVILVEGDSDEYFFRFYFDKFKEENKKIETDVEFLYIGGKDHYSYWKKFLTEYKITAYFIGDLDKVSGGTAAQILAQSKENIFILSQGNLENYIGSVKSNKLENAIDFAKNRYEVWKKDSNNTSKIQELDGIFEKITSTQC